MGSLTYARFCYARAPPEADDEARQLEVLISSWLDHPARLAILFPVPQRNREADATIRRCDGLYHTDNTGNYATTPAAEIAWSLVAPVSDSPPFASEVRGVVIYFHGNGEDADDCIARSASQFHALRLALLLVEYRGYGRSPPATPLLSTLLSDAEPVILGRSVLHEALCAAGLSPQLPPLLFGRSIGGHVAVHLAALRSLGSLSSGPGCAALILESCTASVRHWTHALPDNAPPPEGRPPMPAGLVAIGLLENREKLRAIAAPLLVLHGERDAIVPPFQAELLHRSSGAPADQKRLVRVPGRGHNDLQHHSAYWRSIAEFVESVFESVC